jgi:hypothetical protein
VRRQEEHRGIAKEVPVRRAPIALLLALVLPACGSTVASNGGGDALGAPAAPGLVDDGLGSGGTLDLGVPGADAAAGTAGAAGADGPATAGAPPVAGGTTGALPDGVAGPAGGSGAGPATQRAAVGPGITADKVHLGIAYFPDAAATNATLGASDANSGDQRDYYNAVIEDLNARGGVIGRKVVPVYYEYSSTSGEPLDSQSQGACDHWTKDNKVFAITFRGRVLQECARDAGALILSGDGEAGPAYARLPNLLDPSAVRLERLGAATVRGLNREKYFAPTPDWPTGKVGIVTWQDPNYEYGVEQGYQPALKALGLAAPVRYIAVPQNAGAIADASAAVSSAVLAFRSAGIDHVLIQDGNAGVFGLGGLTLLFLNNAKSQNYYPRYGFNANNVPGFSIYPQDQQRGMLAVDFSDYMPTQDEGIAPNAQRERCFAIMNKRGVATSDQNTYATAAAACDQVWFIETLLRRAAQPTLQGALQAAAGLGTSYRSPQVYGTRLGPDRRDGGELARNARYDEGCACMRYTSKPYAP